MRLTLLWALGLVASLCAGPSVFAQDTGSSCDAPYATSVQINGPTSVEIVFTPAAGDVIFERSFEGGVFAAGADYTDINNEVLTVIGNIVGATTVTLPGNKAFEPGTDYVLRLRHDCEDDTQSNFEIVSTWTTPQLDCSIASAIEVGTLAGGIPEGSAALAQDERDCSKINGQWFSFAGTGNDFTVTYSIMSPAEGGYNVAELSLFADNCNDDALTCLTSPPTVGGGTETLTATIATTAGTTYYIHLGAFGGFGELFELSLEEVIVPVNCSAPDFAYEVTFYHEAATGESTFEYFTDFETNPSVADYELSFWVGTPGFEPGRPATGQISGRRSPLMGGRVRSDIPGLAVGNSYEYYLQYRCDDGTDGALLGPFTVVIEDNGPAPCVFVPTDEILEIGDNDVTLRIGVNRDYQLNGFNHTYEVEVVEAGGTPGTGTAIASVSGEYQASPSTEILAGLESGTDYAYHVRVICPDGDASAWGEANPFTTTGQPPVLECGDDIPVNPTIYVLADGRVNVQFEVDPALVPNINDLRIRYGFIPVGGAPGTPGLGGGGRPFTKESIVFAGTGAILGQDYELSYTWVCADGSDGPTFSIPFTANVTPQVGCPEVLPDLISNSLLDDPLGFIVRYRLAQEDCETAEGYGWEIEIGAEGFTPGNGEALKSDRGVIFQQTVASRYDDATVLPGTTYDHYIRYTCLDGTVGPWVGFGQVTTEGEPPVEECVVDFAYEASVTPQLQYLLVKYELAAQPPAGYSYNIEIGTEGFAPGTGVALDARSGELTSRFVVGGAGQLTPSTTYDHYVRFTCPDGVVGEWEGFGQGTTLDKPVCNDATTLVVGADGSSQWETGLLADIRNGGQICSTSDTRGAWFHFVGDGGLMQVQTLARVAGEPGAQARLFATVLAGNCNGQVLACTATELVSTDERDRTFDYLQTEAGADYYVYLRSTRLLSGAAAKRSKFRVRVLGAATGSVAARASDVSDDASTIDAYDEALDLDTESKLATTAAEKFTLVDEPGFEAVSLYPNPAKTVATLERSETMYSATATLVDGAGRTLRAFDIDRGQSRVRIDLANLPAGTYLLEVTNEVDRRTPVYLVVR